MSDKPNVFSAIITAILSLVIFYISYILVHLIFGFIINILLSLPIIKTLIGWIFSLRGDTPDMVLSVLSPIVTYQIVMLLQEKVNKRTSTRGLSCQIHGVVLVILNAISVAMNLLYGEGILKSLIQLITGIVFFSSGKNLREQQPVN